MVLDPDTKVLTIEGDRVVDTEAPDDDDLLGGGDADVGTTSAAGSAAGDDATAGDVTAGGDAAPSRADGGCGCLGCSQAQWLTI